MTKKISRDDEDKFLKQKISGHELFRKPFSFDTLMDSIQSGKLKLEISQDDGVEVLSKGDLKIIRDAIPFLIQIVNKPRTFIRSKEEKLPVETAKRINSHAISILSRDSNDWYARTALTVKPKFIVSDVNEETLDIYENRFICALIDKVARLIRETHQTYENEQNQYEGARNFDEMANRYHLDQSTNRSLSLYYSICADSARDVDSVYEESLRNMIETLTKIEDKLQLMRFTPLYKELHNKKKVKNPIQRTNILMYDYAYNQAYRLWAELDKTHLEKRQIITYEEISDPEKSENYHLYCFLCLCASIYDMGFKETSGCLISFGKNGLTSDGPLKFYRSEDSTELALTLEEHAFVISHLIKKAKKKEDTERRRNKKVNINTDKDEFETIRISTDYENLDTMDNNKLNDWTTRKLDSFCEECTEPDQYNYGVVSINLSKSCDEMSLQDYVVQRLCGNGDYYHSFDEAHFDDWGNRTGFSIIRPSDLRSNFLRLENILNRHITKYRMLGRDPTPMTTCPVCRSNNIQPHKTEGYVCHDCQRWFTTTKCSNCGHDDIVWVKYLDNDFVNDPDIMRNYEEKKPYQKLSKIEVIMRECTTTAFDIVKDGTQYKLKTICPYCFQRIGDKPKIKKKSQ